MKDDTALARESGSDEPLFQHLFSTAPARERQASVRGFGGSVLLHGLLIFLIIWASQTDSLLLTADLGAGTGISAGAAGGGGGGGGENIAFIDLTPRRPLRSQTGGHGPYSRACPGTHPRPPPRPRPRSHGS